jgi:hypothetical protein
LRRDGEVFRFGTAMAERLLKAGVSRFGKTGGVGSRKARAFSSDNPATKPD